MKKKLLIVMMTTIMAIGTSQMVSACTPKYTPVSSQSWYKGYQNALNNAYKIGKNMVINIKIDSLK